MNTYLLNYNVLETKISFNQLEAFIRDNRKIMQWYSPFLGTYLLKSTETLQSVAESLRGAFDGAPFILTLTFTSQMGGAQAPAVWEWINGHPFGGLNQAAIENKN